VREAPVSPLLQSHFSMVDCQGTEHVRVQLPSSWPAGTPEKDRLEKKLSFATPGTKVAPASKYGN
jgi:hypothetical protein